MDILKGESLKEGCLKTPEKQPVYNRQRFLLAFLKELCDEVSATDLQKLVFLYSMHMRSDYYHFVPYKFGAYSFQLARDIEVLKSKGYIDTEGIKVAKTATVSGLQFLCNKDIDSSRGNALIRKTYEEYPYYAVNSEIAERIMSYTKLQKIKKIRDSLIQNEQVLFTIGYEGITVEGFINSLILNNIAVLCDVRKAPISRKFGFSKNKLKHILETIGIQYIHIPALGIESEKRKELNNSSDYDSLFSDYEKTLTAKNKELQEIYNTLTTHNRIALMCFEGDSKCCHRRLIKDFIVNQYNVKGIDL